MKAAAFILAALAPLAIMLIMISKAAYALASFVVGG